MMRVSAICGILCLYPIRTLKTEYGRNRNTKTQLVASPVNKDRATASPLYKDMAQLPGNCPFFPASQDGVKKMKNAWTTIYPIHQAKKVKLFYKMENSKPGTKLTNTTVKTIR